MRVFIKFFIRNVIDKVTTLGDSLPCVVEEPRATIGCLGGNIYTRIHTCTCTYICICKF